MYISGTIYDYEWRVHQFCTSSGDMVQYHDESEHYTGDKIRDWKWDREEDKRVGTGITHAIRGNFILI